GAAALLGTAGAGGVVTRGADLKIPLSDLPALLLNNTHEAASQAAMLALPAVKMDIVVRSDVGKTFVLGAEPATLLSNWVELPNPVGGALTAVFGSTGPAVTVPGLPALAGAIDAADELPLYDASSGTHRRVSLATLLAGSTSLTSAAPADIGTQAMVGSATTAARADHVHKLPATGVTAATYTNATLTVDATGRITGASSGASGAGFTDAIGPRPLNFYGGTGGSSPFAARLDHGHGLDYTYDTSGVTSGLANYIFADMATGKFIPVPINALWSYLTARTSPLDNDLLPISTTSGSLNKATVAQLFTNRLLSGGSVINARLVGVREEKQVRLDVATAATLPTINNHNTYHYRLTGNATLTLPARLTNVNCIIGITLIIDQDGTGGRTLTLNAPAGETIKWHGGVMGSIATAANARTRIALSAAQGETRWDAAIVYKEA
ncbi:hypothetical protein VZ95_16805, partial [Elstera litoralis]